MATYNQYRTSPIRTRLTDKSLSDTIIGKLDADESLMRNIARTVNRTWVFNAEGNIVDANQCEHVTDRLWLLGCGHVNCTGISSSGTKYYQDADYDTSCFSGKFTTRDNIVVANAQRVKYQINSDGSTGGSAGSWWLRSAYSSNDYLVGCVYAAGNVYDYGAISILGCSPAFQIG